MRCGNELSAFIDKAASLYALAAELPTTGINDLGEFRPTTAMLPRVTMAATVATFLGVIFGAAGLLAGFLLGNVTVASAASVATALGGGLGAVIGFGGVSTEREKLKAIQAGYVAVICLNILWILSCYGWGKGATIPEDLLNAIDERTKRIVPGIDPINWHKATSDEMKNWIIRFLNRVAE